MRASDADKGGKIAQLTIMVSRAILPPLSHQVDCLVDLEYSIFQVPSSLISRVSSKLIGVVGAEFTVHVTKAWLVEPLVVTLPNVQSLKPPALARLCDKPAVNFASVSWA